MAASLLAALLLIGCGGGGGGGGNPISDGNAMPPASNPSPPISVPDNTFGVDCSSSNCGAVDTATYAGNGVGSWRYNNTTALPAVVPVGLSGTGGRTVTLVQTHVGAPGSGLASRTSAAFFGNVSGGPDNEPADAASASADGSARINHIPEQIRRFQPPELEVKPETEPQQETLSVARSVAVPSAPLANSIGSSDVWYDHEGSSHVARLEKRLNASDGRVINFWVEVGEYSDTGSGVVTLAQLNALADSFASGGSSVYSKVTSLAGQPWGSHNFGNLIAPSQPLNVVLLNLTPDDQPFGLVGYFYALNNFLNGSNGITTSNESLSFYLDTETLYLGGNYALPFTVSTLAHELVHMINFYQRAVVRSTPGSDYSFDTWLEEMSALMMEDLVGLAVTPTYHAIRDDRLPAWLNSGDFNCDVTVFDDDIDSPCFGYNLAGSLGAWLLRHYGVDFYRALLVNTSSTDSIALLDDTIRDRGGAGFKDAVRRWGTLLALLPAATSPAWFGLPERSEQGYTLPALDGAAYANVRQLPQVAPVSLQVNGHFPQQRSNVADPYVETITVPAYTTLTVIVK